MAEVRGTSITVTYELTLSEGETADGKVRRLALEQTVELPDGCYPQAIEERIVGRVESLEPGASGRWQALVAYPGALVNGEVPALLNLLFGNVSMQQGVRVTGFDLPRELLARYPGPRFGTAGLRSALGETTGRALLCTAAKPVGLSSKELAERCAAFARAGIDVIKDDHGVMDQPYARFHDRIGRCQEAVARGCATAGGRTLYFPNITGPTERMAERVEHARAAGCAGVLVSPFVVGLDALRRLAETAGLILLAHPTFSGTITQPSHGIAAPVLYGRLLRLLGSDAVIYVNAGGRFPVAESEAHATNARLREPWGDLRPALPVPGGGVDAASVPHWLARFGSDVMLLVGSSLYAQHDIERATAALAEVVRRHGRC